MEKWIPASKVREQFGFSKTLLSAKCAAGLAWARKNGTRLEFDCEHEDYQAWTEKAQKRSEQFKIQSAIAMGKEFPEAGRKPYAMESATASTGTDTDTADLMERSRTAKLMEPILKNETTRLKNEQERISLEVASGNLIEWPLAEFLFVGYCERLNTETLMFPKKFQPKLEHLVDDYLIRSPLIETVSDEQIKLEVLKVLSGVDKKALAREIVSIILREHEEIIRTVKAAQIEDVTNWKKELNK